jgi:hypothetical protein
MSKIIKWLHKLIPKMVLPSAGSSISLGQVRDERGGSGETSLNAESVDYVANADTDVTTGAESPAGSDSYLGENRATMKVHPYALSAFYGWDYSACLTVGTNINMADGSIKLIEDLEEGDEILSAILPGLGTVYSEYRIYDLDKVTLSSTKVEQVVFDFSNHYYIINDKFKGTKHPTMAFRNNYYEWWQTKDLLVNDKLITTDLSLDDIVSVKLVGDEIETVGIRVDKYNTYFAEGYLVHD